MEEEKSKIPNTPPVPEKAKKMAREYLERNKSLVERFKGKYILVVGGDDYIDYAGVDDNEKRLWRYALKNYTDKMARGELCVILIE